MAETLTAAPATVAVRIALRLAQITAAADRDLAQALADAQQRAEDAPSDADPVERFLAQLALGVLQQRAARYDLALSLLRRALEAAEQLGERSAQGAVRRALGNVHVEIGEYAPALAEFLHALAADEAAGDEASRAATLRTIGVVYSKAGDPEQGLQFYRDSLALTRKLADAPGSARTLNNIGINLKNLGRLDESEAALRESLALFRQLDSPAGLAGAASNLALTLHKRGDLAAAEALQRESIDVAQRAGYELALVNAQRGLSEALLAAGRLDDAHAAARAALATAEAMGSRPEQARCLRALVDVCKARGDAAAALAHFESFHAIERALFTEESDRKLRALQVSYQVAQLARQSAEDPLTGLANRRSLDARLAAEWAAVRSGGSAHGRRLSLALIDVDEFKQVNDRWSHAMGDAVLRAVARRLREFCRESDFVARYGGEEFALLLPATDVDGAQVLCEKLRATLAAHDWNALAPGLRVTVSIGVADDAGAADVESLLAAADAQLYEAKRGGRNQVRAPLQAAGKKPSTDR
jgi:diguanylate cyclase (GGDEF)-like protein